MDLVLFSAPGRLAKLTNAHEASPHGRPVLVLQSEVVSGAFGPTDAIPVVPFPGPRQEHDPEITIDAGTVVAVWGYQKAETDEELDAVRAFLAQ